LPLDSCEFSIHPVCPPFEQVIKLGVEVMGREGFQVMSLLRRHLAYAAFARATPCSYINPLSMSLLVSIIAQVGERTPAKVSDYSQVSFKPV
jgi:hypothetical protein